MMSKPQITVARRLQVTTLHRWLRRLKPAPNTELIFP